MDEAKRELVHNWLLKASHDLAAARVLAQGDQPILDVAIYHCQQAAEKTVKAFLVFQDEFPDRTHDVDVLIQKATRFEPGLIALRAAAIRLTPYATLFRYPRPINVPERNQVEEALNDAAGIYNQVLSVLPPEVRPHTHKNGDSSTAEDAADPKPES
jgi:HEPN domain-containing protein